jgi:hypothetical protein
MNLMDWGFVAGVVGEGWIACMLAQAEALAFDLVGEVYQLFTEALRALLFPYQCTTSLLQPAEPLHAFW